MRHTYMVLSLSLLVCQMLAVIFSFTQPAYAYVDPGSGLFALQIISTTFAGLIFVLRRRFVQFVGRLARSHEAPKDIK